MVAKPNEPLDKSELTAVRLLRLKRLKTSPFAAIFNFSPKNHGVEKNFSKVKSRLLYPGSS